VSLGWPAFTERQKVSGSVLGGQRAATSRRPAATPAALMLLPRFTTAVGDSNRRRLAGSIRRYGRLRALGLRRRQLGMSSGDTPSQSIGGAETSRPSQASRSRTRGASVQLLRPPRRLRDEVAERNLVRLKLLAAEVECDGKSLRRSVREKGCSDTHEPVRGYRHLAR
jgi:hypothetical protein